MNPWNFLRYLFLPAMIITGYMLGGWWNFMVPAACFIIHPVTSLITKRAPAHSHEEEQQQHPSFLYRLVALLFVPVLLTVTAWAVIKSNDTSAIEFAGLCLSVGIVNGVLGFTLAHEFSHRFTMTGKIAARLLMLQNNYPYYGIEHVWGHHVYACTPKDPHSAPFNESFYRFLPRSLVYTAVNAWEIEATRLRRIKIPLFGIHNRMLQYTALHLLLAILIIILAGWNAFLFFFLQSFVAILLLHITDYLQHYGLMRKEIAPGKFEKITAVHAWNNNKGKDGLNLFQLEKHADHHLHPTHSYEQLINHEESPQLPTGYSGMIVLALVPPLWFRIMNKRITSFNTQKQL